MSKYRYPGLNIYSKEDAFIFKGRDDDSKSLLTQINLSRTLVLHSESGIGKSSLIEAGLLPLIENEKEKYIPVIVRLTELAKNERKDILINFTKEKINEVVPDLLNKDLLLISSQPDKNLWTLNKLLEREGKKLLLIYDQFENLQAFDSRQIEYFKKELFDLLNSKIPLDLYTSIEQQFNTTSKTEQSQLNKEYEILSMPSAAKILFVIREDKLGTMVLLSECFPDILKHDFTIKPLCQEDAYKAIVEPAQAKGDFESLPFEFENEQILKSLITKIADNETGLVDPIQLQIIARDLERNIVIKQNKTVIRQTDIPDVDDIINKFYADCWDTVYKEMGVNEKEFLEIKKNIVPELIVNDQRDLVIAGRVKDEKPNKAIQILIKEGLIRKIPSGKEVFYQLNHDRLIEPTKNDILRIEERERAELAVAEETQKLEAEKLLAIQRANDLEKIYEQKRKTELEKRKRKNIVIIASIAIAALLIVLINAFYQNRNKAAELKERGFFTSLILIRKQNPTFAYFLARNWANSNKTSPIFNKFISYYDTSRFAFLKNTFPFSNTTVAIEQDGHDSLIVTDRYSITTWNTKTNLIVKQKKLSNGYYVGKKIINGKKYYLVINEDSLQIQDIEGNIQKEFLATDRDENIDISKDGNYIVIGKYVYNYKTQALIDSLIETDYNSHDQMATIFLNDGKHVAAGYWSGYKFIFRIDEKAKEKIRITAVYPPASETNEVISCLTVDSKDKLLYAGTRQNTIEVWKLDSLKCVDSVCNEQKDYLGVISENMQKAKPFKVYKGHTANINSVAISPDDSLLLSGSDDNTAILWNAVSGKTLSVLRGMASKVTQTGFLDNTEMYTATDDALLFLWSKDKASRLYASHQLSKFSPFDYYTVGLAKENDEFKGHIYDTTRTADFFSNTLHYIISMPVYNQYPEDAEYLNNLKLSLSEIDTMYNNLTKRKDFESSISIPNIKLLYKYYNTLKLSTPDLLLETEDESTKAKYERFASHHIRNMKALFLDTSDIKTAISNASDFRLIGGYYRDSLKDTETSLYYYKLSTQLLNTFSKKFSNDPDLNTELITNYGDFAVTYIYAKKPDSAIIIANQLKTIKNGNGIADLRIIQAYLLQNKYNEAVNLYELKKDKVVRPDEETTESQSSLKDWLLPKLDKLKKWGLGNESIDRFVDYLKQQPTPKKLKNE